MLVYSHETLPQVQLNVLTGGQNNLVWMLDWGHIQMVSSHEMTKSQIKSHIRNRNLSCVVLVTNIKRWQTLRTLLRIHSTDVQKNCEVEPIQQNIWHRVWVPMASNTAAVKGYMPSAEEMSRWQRCGFRCGRLHCRGQRCDSDYENGTFGSRKKACRKMWKELQLLIVNFH